MVPGSPSLILPSPPSAHISPLQLYVLASGHTARDQVHVQIPLSNVEEFRLHLNLVIPWPGDPQDPHGSAGESSCTIAAPSSEDSLA